MRYALVLREFRSWCMYLRAGEKVVQVLYRIKPNCQHNRSINKALKKGREQKSGISEKSNPEEGLFEIGFEGQAAFQPAEKYRKEIQHRDNKSKWNYGKKKKKQ